MPSTYAHYRFGRDMTSELDFQKQQLIHEHQAYFDLGVHGPDILFYYHPLHHNEVTALGNTIHSQPAATFFEAAFKIDDLSKDACKLAYLYGYLCHFALDTVCHTYIEDIQATGRACHSEIEDDLERALMVKDHLDPVHYPLYRCIPNDPHLASPIAAFYPSLDEKTIQTAIKGMRFYHRLLFCPHSFKRHLLIAGIHAIHQHPNLTGHIIMPRPDPRLVDVTAHLLHSYDIAKQVAHQLFASIDHEIANQKPSHPLYQRTFDINEEEINLETSTNQA